MTSGSISRFAITSLFACALVFWGYSCNRAPEHDWNRALPYYTPAVWMTGGQNTAGDLPAMELTAFVDELTASSVAGMDELERRTGERLDLTAMAMFPTQANQWDPLWVGSAPQGTLDRIAGEFYEEFAENEYRFQDQQIHILHFEDREWYAVQMHSWVLISESSYAIEEALRSYMGKIPSMAFSPGEKEPGQLLFNTPHFSTLAGQLSAPRFRPRFSNILQGTDSGLLDFDREDDGEERDLTISGRVPLNDEEPSPLVSSISNENVDFLLDRYVPDNTAGFGLFSAPVAPEPPEETEPVSGLDSLLASDAQRHRELAEPLHPEFAYVAFSATGMLSVGESVFIRRLDDAAQFRSTMQQLAREGYVDYSSANNLYTVHSNLLSQLVGSRQSDYSEFSLMISGESVILSTRGGLVERVHNDRQRSQVMYYEDRYTSIRESMPGRLSGFFFVNSEDFFQYLAPNLDPNHYAEPVFNQFNYAALGMELDEDEDHLNLHMHTYRTEERTRPVVDRWLFPIDHAMTGPPERLDVGGTERNELLFATEGGTVHILDSNGTSVNRMSTENHTPIGAPVAADWYGNNQPEILMAAGNRIFAWNAEGQSLPNFPFTLPEQISAPITVADVNRDGNMEVIVATEDREIHVLNGRGNNIQGWPQSVNATITRQPVFDAIDGEYALWAVAENALFSWNARGDLNDHYPVFLEAPFTGRPTVFGDHVIAGAADGSLYAIGSSPLFEDTFTVETDDMDQELVEQLDQQEDEDRVHVQQLEVSSSPITGAPVVEELQVRLEDDQTESGNSGATVTETMIVAQSLNGSLYAYNTRGELRFTRSYGQQTREGSSPIVEDINGNGRMDILGLADIGRLYGWEVLSGARHVHLPTAALQFPVFMDVNRDGQRELIGETRDGLRAWSITGQLLAGSDENDEEEEEAGNEE